MSDGSEFNLIAMWVRPAYRGAGVAPALVEAIKESAVSRGNSRVVLDVSLDNEHAAALYRKLGFSFIPEWGTLESHPEITVQKMEWLAPA